MTAREKIDAAVEYVKSQGIADSTAAPPFWRLLWRYGIHLPPPHFVGFFPLVFLTGLPFAVVMLVACVLVLVIAGTSPISQIFMVPLGGAGAFGLSMAAYYRWSARNLELPLWSQFGASENDEDSGW